MRSFLVIACVIAGCSGADATPMVRMHAAQDFVCAESTVVVHREVNGTYSAVGCGRHGTYRAVCEGTRCAVSPEGGNLTDSPSRAGAPEPVSNDLSR